MDAYLVGFAVIGVGMIFAGFNLGGDDHQLPGARNDLGPGPHLRLGRYWPPARCSTLATPDLMVARAASGSSTAPPRPPSS